MSDKQTLDAKTLKILKQLKKITCLNCDLPEINQLKKQLNECVRSYEYYRSC